jgi:hypothetical protein
VEPRTLDALRTLDAPRTVDAPRTLDSLCVAPQRREPQKAGKPEQFLELGRTV